jgi:hypothetical protein
MPHNELQKDYRAIVPVSLLKAVLLTTTYTWNIRFDGDGKIAATLHLETFCAVPLLARPKQICALETCRTNIYRKALPQTHDPDNNKREMMRLWAAHIFYFGLKLHLTNKFIRENMERPGLVMEMEVILCDMS